MQLFIPDFAVVVLIGTSGSGKSSFAQRHFLPTEVIASDACRALVCDDENDQTVSADAFELLYLILAKRLAHQRLAVIDATNVMPDARTTIIALANRYQAPLIALVLDIPAHTAIARNRQRTDRNNMPDRVIIEQRKDFLSAVQGLPAEGFTRIYTLTPNVIDLVMIVRGQ